MAVEVSTKPVPATKLCAIGKPSDSPTQVSGRDRRPHLQQPEAEDLAAHRPQARRLHLQPDDEQEQDHAELGDVDDRLWVLEIPEEMAEPVGSDGKSGGEISEHRPKSGPPEQRHRDHRRREEQHDGVEVVVPP